jgi:hypothetical protein
MENAVTPHGDSPARPGRIRKGLTYTTALIVVAGLLNALPASALTFNPRPEVEDVPSVEGSDLVSEAIAQDDAVAQAAVTEPEQVDWPEGSVLDVDLTQVAVAKLDRSEDRYPAEVVRGRADLRIDD